jgi:outer membrane protein
MDGPCGGVSMSDTGVRAAVFAAVIFVAGQAAAADVTARSPDLSPWQVRVRALGVITNDSGSVDGVPGSDLSYSDIVVPELDITYYFTDNIAAEMIFGTAKASIYGEGTLSGLDEIGDTWVLPPTVTLQYHFTNLGPFKPYIGAGLNYTIFLNEGDGSGTDLKIDDAFGVALQIGFDYMLDEHWGVNFDVKKLFLETDFEVDAGGPASGEAELDPWLIGGGVTYRF